MGEGDVRAYVLEAVFEGREHVLVGAGGGN